MRNISYFIVGGGILAIAACQTVPAMAPTGTPSVAMSSPTPVADASSAPARSTVKLTGSVYDAAFIAVPEATVRAEGGGHSVTGLTKADGSYELEVLPGTMQVSVNKAGWTERTQRIDAVRDTVLEFGGKNPQNPYFLSNAPEIVKVEVDESKPGGPLTLRATLSEPLPLASQLAFRERVELKSGTSTPFLKFGSTEKHLTNTMTWDAEGRVFTLSYNGPYVPSGRSPMWYSFGLRQNKLDRVDPATQDPLWEDMGIADADGNAIGMGRASYSVLLPALSFLDHVQVADKSWGRDLAQRRWNFNHMAMHSFQAAQDVSPPELVSVRVRTEVRVGEALVEELVLQFAEPMQVVKSQSERTFTNLNKDREILSARVSTSVDGASARAVSLHGNASLLRFDEADARVVYMHFPAGTFKDNKWVEVTLLPELLDPAGNPPAADKNRMSGPIL